ncbi:GNAT family N-acetyltransferase [Streptomyces sp. NPDC090493]|uniref:GNAT family N-acetyltransferase n=1 Tax=Streptomyces sp. NPDC090493 TaxID=3365964 RepID=UPI003827AEDD
MSVHTVGGSAAVTWMEQQWAALYQHDPAATPFGSPQWLLGWASQLSASASPLLLIAVGRSGVLGALPLLHEDLGGITAVRTMPYCEYVAPVGPGSQDHQVAEALAVRLTGLACDGALVTLENVPFRSALATALRRQPGWRHATSRTATVPLPLNTGAMSKSVRRQHTRRERTLADRGRVTYRRTRTAADLLDAIPSLEALYTAQRETDGLGPAPDAWTEVLRRCAGGAFIAEASLDGVLMASQLCLVRGRHCYSVLPAMTPAMRHLAPGHALLRYLATHLAVSGFSVLDLGPTRETPGQIEYKAQYAPVWGVNLSSVADGGTPTAHPGAQRGSPHQTPGDAFVHPSLTKDGRA